MDIEDRTKCRIVAPVTLNGQLAGPDIEDNYLAFVEGDEVYIVQDYENGTVEVVGIAPWGRPIEQTMDLASLVPVEGD